MPSLAELRQEYMQSGLTEADAGDDPIALFHLWFEAALTAGLPERLIRPPHALLLARD